MKCFHASRSKAAARAGTSALRAFRPIELPPPAPCGAWRSPESTSMRTQALLMRQQAAVLQSWPLGVLPQHGQIMRVVCCQIPELRPHAAPFNHRPNSEKPEKDLRVSGLQKSSEAFVPFGLRLQSLGNPARYKLMRSQRNHGRHVQMHSRISHKHLDQQFCILLPGITAWGSRSRLSMAFRFAPQPTRPSAVHQYRPVTPCQRLQVLDLLRQLLSLGIKLCHLQRSNHILQGSQGVHGGKVETRNGASLVIEIQMLLGSGH